MYPSWYLLSRVRALRTKEQCKSLLPFSWSTQPASVASNVSCELKVCLVLRRLPMDFCVASSVSCLKGSQRATRSIRFLSTVNQSEIAVANPHAHSSLNPFKWNSRVDTGETGVLKWVWYNRTRHSIDPAVLEDASVRTNKNVNPQSLGPSIVSEKEAVLATKNSWAMATDRYLVASSITAWYRIEVNRYNANVSPGAFACQRCEFGIECLFLIVYRHR